MLHDQKVVIDNDIVTISNMIYQSVIQIIMLTNQLKNLLKQPQYGMPYNYYENQGFYATGNKAKLASLAFRTQQINLGRASTFFPMTTFVNSSQNS